VAPPATSSVTVAWSAAPSLLRPRSAHGVVAAAGALWAIGGTGVDRAPVLQIERFDGVAWTEATTLPGDGVNAPSVAALGGRIYVIGGFAGTTNQPTNDVRVFDIATSTWTKAAPLPTSSGGQAAVVLDGRIHVIGGGTSRETIANHVVYDPTSDTWASAAPLPRSEGSPGAVVLDGRLWAIGGRSGSDDFGDVYIYDPATDSWSRGPSIEPRGTAGAVVICGTILLVGGERQSDSTVLADTLILSRGTWTRAQPMPTARSFARAAVIDDTVYIVGGSTVFGQGHASSGSNTVEKAATTC
jgi:N-acetylneuraminic acid mutarotase